MWSPELQKLEGHPGPVNAVASRRRLAVGVGLHGLVSPAVGRGTGQKVQKLEGHTISVTAVAFSPNGSMLASASHDRTVRLWDAGTGQEVQKLEGDPSWARAVAFSPNSSLLASASTDQTVRLWDADTGREMQKLEGHADRVNAVAFSPDGSLLASAFNDKTVRLWDAGMGQEMQEFKNMPGVSTISITIDNSTILTNRGAISIQKGPSTGLIIKSWATQTWVQQNNRNLLWLPHEYRNTCSAFHNDTFAFGVHSGQVSFIQLDQS